MLGLKKEIPCLRSIKGNKFNQLKITDPIMNVNLFKRVAVIQTARLQTSDLGLVKG